MNNMKKMKKSKLNKARRFNEIIVLANSYITADWPGNAAMSSKAKDYRIVKKFPDAGLDIRLYLSDEGKIRLCVYSNGKNIQKDIQTLREINIRPSTGAEFQNGGEFDKTDVLSYNLCHIFRCVDWSSMNENDVVTLCADYIWLIAELHRIGAV